MDEIVDDEVGSTVRLILARLDVMEQTLKLQFATLGKQLALVSARDERVGDFAFFAYLALALLVWIPIELALMKTFGLIH